MRIYRLLFIMLFTSVLSAQTNTNYIPYHQSCRKAEKNFIDSNYKVCFNTYDSVFANYEILFPRDCFMAAQMAFKVHNDSLAVNYLIKAIPFGLNADLIFKQDTALSVSQLTKSKYWMKYLNNYDSLHKKYLNKVDWKLKRELYQMAYVDQVWRQRNNKWFNRNFRKGLEKKFDKINKTHIAFLDSVFKVKGYPGIWLTGVGDSINPAFNNNKNLSDMVAIILYHYESAYLKFGEFLKKEIELGHIHPRTYAMIRDFQDRFSVKEEKDQKMYYNIWWEATNFNEQEFEQNCYEIGCPTKQHLRKLQKAVGKDIDVFWLPFR